MQSKTNATLTGMCDKYQKIIVSDPCFYSFNYHTNQCLL